MSNRGEGGGEGGVVVVEKKEGGREDGSLVVQKSQNQRGDLGAQAVSRYLEESYRCLCHQSDTPCESQLDIFGELNTSCAHSQIGGISFSYVPSQVHSAGSHSASGGPPESLHNKRLQHAQQAEHPQRVQEHKRPQPLPDLQEALRLPQSGLSVAEHADYLALITLQAQLQKSRQSLTGAEQVRFQQYQVRVKQEQAQYHAKVQTGLKAKLKQRYQLKYPPVMRYAEDVWRRAKEQLRATHARYWSLHKTLTLPSSVEFDPKFGLTYEAKVDLPSGEAASHSCPDLVMPSHPSAVDLFALARRSSQESMQEKETMLHLQDSKESSSFLATQQHTSRTHSQEGLLMQEDTWAALLRQLDAVSSDAALCTLLDLHPPHYQQSFGIPVEVRDHKQVGQGFCVLLGEPLPPREPSLRDAYTVYAEHALSNALCQRPSPKDHLTPQQRRQEESKRDHHEAPYFSYSLWALSDLKLLVRCPQEGKRVDPRSLLKGGQTEQKSQQSYAVLGAHVDWLAPDWAHEQLSLSERVRWWLHLYVRGFTARSADGKHRGVPAELIFARVAVQSLELVSLSIKKLKDVYPGGKYLIIKESSEKKLRILKPCAPTDRPAPDACSTDASRLDLDLTAAAPSCTPAADDSSSTTTPGPACVYDLHAAHPLEPSQLSPAPYVPPAWSGGRSGVHQIPDTFRPSLTLQLNQATQAASRAEPTSQTAIVSDHGSNHIYEDCFLFYERGWCPGLEKDASYTCRRSHFRTKLIKYCYMEAAKGTCYKKKGNIDSNCQYPHFSLEKVRSMASQTWEAQSVRQQWYSGNRNNLLHLLNHDVKKKSKKEKKKKKKKKQKDAIKEDQMHKAKKRKIGKEARTDTPK